MKDEMDAAEPAALTRKERELAEKLGEIRPLVGGCHRRMGSPLGRADLEEVIQETSLAAWKQRATFRGGSDVDTWLYGIARYTILGHLRRGRQIRYVESELTEDVAVPTDPGPGPGTQVDTGIARVIDLGLSEVGTTVAAICRARALEGHSFVQISADLKVSEANVKARFYRSLPQLRRRLSTLWNDPAG